MGNIQKLFASTNPNSSKSFSFFFLPRLRFFVSFFNEQQNWNSPLFSPFSFARDSIVMNLFFSNEFPLFSTEWIQPTFPFHSIDKILGKKNWDPRGSNPEPSSVKHEHNLWAIRLHVFVLKNLRVLFKHFDWNCLITKNFCYVGINFRLISNPFNHLFLGPMGMV